MIKGLLLVDKPSGMTSHDVVDHVRKAAGIRRVGHTGTLDPGATGLLVLCLGKATRLSEFLTGLDKTYEGVMKLGVVTDSHDLEGEVLETHPIPDISEDGVRAIFARYTGDIMQIPPMVSAVKVGGERLYKKARKGEEVDRPARPVTVYEFALLGFTAAEGGDPSPTIRFRVRCSRGTYVRTLCHDIGRELGCGGVLASLTRTAVGGFELSEAAALESLQSPEDLEAKLLPMGQALAFPEAVVNPAGQRTVLSGGALGPRHFVEVPEIGADAAYVQVKSPHGRLLAIATVEQAPAGSPASGQGATFVLKPKRVFN